MGCSPSADEENKNPGNSHAYNDTTEGEDGENTTDPEEFVVQSTAEPEKEVPVVTRQRDPKHIFTLTLKKRPLGIVLTSDPDGYAAYVTSTNGNKNKVVGGDNLPVNSKLLKVNSIHVEDEAIICITDTIRDNLRRLPLDLTFCHPEGLDEDERPDPNPDQDFTKK